MCTFNLLSTTMFNSAIDRYLPLMYDFDNVGTTIGDLQDGQGPHNFPCLHLFGVLGAGILVQSEPGRR